MKRFLTLLAIRKMQINATISCHLIPTKTAIIKKKDKYFSGCEDIRNLKHCWLQFLKKVKHRITIWPSNSSPMYIYKKNKTVVLEIPSLPSCVCFTFTQKTLFLPLLVSKCDHAKQFSMTPAGCPTIQLSSHTVLLERASDSTGEGLNPKTLLPPTSDACHK